MEKFDKWISANYPMFEMIGEEESDTVSRLVRAVASDLFSKLEEAKRLLADARHQLPLAAALWNEDENRELADFHVPLVMDLISKIDAFQAQK
ncbi:hypothetical protein ACOTHJ_32855 [Achromobacter xylosoxidans]